MRRDSVAGVLDSGGALRLVTISFGEDRETTAQTWRRFQRASGSREGRALKPGRRSGLAADEGRWRGQPVATGHRFEDRHSAVALFDGDAELNALHQALETCGIVALFGTDHPFGHDPAAVGQGQHDAAVQALNAQVDLIVRREGIGNDLKRIVHDASPPD